MPQTTSHAEENMIVKKYLDCHRAFDRDDRFLLMKNQPSIDIVHT
jgi:hypothetical protein